MERGRYEDSFHPLQDAGNLKERESETVAGKERRIMNQKELLRNQIEEEREKLNALLAGGTCIEDAYGQSLVVDQLIERYMNL